MPAVTICSDFGAPQNKFCHCFHCFLIYFCFIHYARAFDCVDQHSENEDHGIWSHHFMGNRWGNSGNRVRLYFGGPKITADGDCSHEIKRHLLLGREVMTNLDSIFKSRDIALPTKVRLVKAMVFPVVMYGCESWTVKKAERQRIDAFELWCWRRLLRVPWTARTSNHPVLRRPLLLPPSIFPSVRVFSNESILCIRWPKYWSFSFSISPSNNNTHYIIP